MLKVFRLVAMCAISVAFATWSIAWAQTYTTIDYPGATATTLNGGPIRKVPPWAVGPTREA
jgi:hypothetical protein